MTVLKNVWNGTQKVFKTTILERISLFALSSTPIRSSLSADSSNWITSKINKSQLKTVRTYINCIPEFYPQKQRVESERKFRRTWVRMTLYSLLIAITRYPPFLHREENRNVKITYKIDKSWNKALTTKAQGKRRILVEFNSSNLFIWK